MSLSRNQLTNQKIVKLFQLGSIWNPTAFADRHKTIHEIAGLQEKGAEYA